jgi:hypothetical protein
MVVVSAQMRNAARALTLVQPRNDNQTMPDTEQANGRAMRRIQL